MAIAAATGKNNELYGIQMLRAVAALAVVTHHSLEESNGAAGKFSPDWLTTSGASGVDIFFVISGFIMLHVTFRGERAPITPASFLVRRATRIYPFYWLCCFLILLSSSIRFMQNHSWNVGDLLTSFLLFPNAAPIINVSWTLVYEVYFYLIFALMLLAKKRSAAVIGSTAVIVGLLFISDILPSGVARDFLANPIPLEFCMGLWLAWAFRQAKRWPVGIVIILLGFAALAVAPMFTRHPDTSGLPGLLRVLVWGVPTCLIVAGSLTVGPPNNKLTRFAVLLGDASYALYLTHVFVMLVYARLLKTTALGRVDQLFFVPVVVLGTIATALLAHIFLERPLLSLIRGRTGRQKVHAGPV